MDEEFFSQKNEGPRSINMSHFLFKRKTWNQYRYDDKNLDLINDTYLHFTFGELKTDDFSNNQPIFTDERKNRYLHHIEEGHRCFGFKDSEENVAAYFWLSLGGGKISLAPVFKKTGWVLSDREAYIWDCRTIDQHQRKGLYREGLRRLVQFCRKNNYQTVMMSTEVNNKSSHAGIIASGFHYHGKVSFIFLRWIKIVLCEGKKPHISRYYSPVTTSVVFPEKRAANV